MTQAEMLKELISDNLAAQAGTIYVLFEDGSQLALNYLEGNTATQYTDQVLVTVVESSK